MRHVGPDDPPTSRCGSCRREYNPYAWQTCPKCKATERGQYALRCRDCRNPFYADDRTDCCPECGSGDTALYAKPDG
jgi:Zn finger protein HypA/HybF involved in hydrogenase expression